MRILTKMQKAAE